jgi:hypothetical protein
MILAAMTVPAALPAAEEAAAPHPEVRAKKHSKKAKKKQAAPRTHEGVNFVFLPGDYPPFNLGSWHPGEEYSSGSDWLALACAAESCAFEPATLTVEDEGYAGPYDDPNQPAPGQRLHFMMPKTAKAHSIAWFQAGQAAYPWIKPGPVTTYYAPGGTLKRPASPGSMEALIQLPNGQSLTFVPMIKNPIPPIAEDSSEPFYLQVRINGKRQLLPGVFGPCTGRVDPKGYIAWVGDLDGDGKPDFLIDWVTSANQGGGIQLYLSSLAKPGELVGLAGGYETPSSGSEC